ncbi:basic proline-rich protein-like [Mustela putorius furo]|uniref:Basic proline-rich protein-like n=1 Tax=Mustela putorius furo TaxID=9669 RepID=A0A8U0RAE5_MUSPF|nr:basic proline-rich protein-like [Mustela putorius furo]
MRRRQPGGKTPGTNREGAPTAPAGTTCAGNQHGSVPAAHDQHPGARPAEGEGPEKASFLKSSHRGRLGSFPPRAGRLPHWAAAREDGRGPDTRQAAPGPGGRASVPQAVRQTPATLRQPGRGPPHRQGVLSQTHDPPLPTAKHTDKPRMRDIRPNPCAALLKPVTVMRTQESPRHQPIPERAKRLLSGGASPGVAVRVGAIGAGRSAAQAAPPQSKPPRRGQVRQLRVSPTKRLRTRSGEQLRAPERPRVRSPGLHTHSGHLLRAPRRQRTPRTPPSDASRAASATGRQEPGYRGERPPGDGFPGTRGLPRPPGLAPEGAASWGSPTSGTWGGPKSGHRRAPLADCTCGTFGSPRGAGSPRAFVPAPRPAPPPRPPGPGARAPQAAPLRPFPCSRPRSAPRPPPARPRAPPSALPPPAPHSPGRPSRSSFVPPALRAVAPRSLGFVVFLPPPPRRREDANQRVAAQPLRCCPCGAASAPRQPGSVRGGGGGGRGERPCDLLPATSLGDRTRPGQGKAKAPPGGENVCPEERGAESALPASGPGRPRRGLSEPCVRAGGKRPALGPGEEPRRDPASERFPLVPLSTGAAFCAIGLALVLLEGLQLNRGSVTLARTRKGARSPAQAQIKALSRTRHFWVDRERWEKGRGGPARQDDSEAGGIPTGVV